MEERDRIKVAQVATCYGLLFIHVFGVLFLILYLGMRFLLSFPYMQHNSAWRGWELSTIYDIPGPMFAAAHAVVVYGERWLRSLSDEHYASAVCSLVYCIPLISFRLCMCPSNLTSLCDLFRTTGDSHVGNFYQFICRVLCLHAGIFDFGATHV